MLDLDDTRPPSEEDKKLPSTEPVTKDQYVRGAWVTITRDFQKIYEERHGKKMPEDHCMRIVRKFAHGD